MGGTKAPGPPRAARRLTKVLKSPPVLRVCPGTPQPVPHLSGTVTVKGRRSAHCRLQVFMQKKPVLPAVELVAPRRKAAIIKYGLLY